MPNDLRRGWDTAREHVAGFELKKTVAKRDITKRETLKVSNMPEGLAAGMSTQEFKNDLIKNGWVYGNVDNIIDKPVKIGDLANDVERSQMGLALLTIAEIFDIPLKGKYFAPFLQFRFVDFMKSKGLYSFEGTDKSTIQKLAHLILTDKNALFFLYSDMKPDAPKELRHFLQDAMNGASWIQQWVDNPDRLSRVSF